MLNNKDLRFEYTRGKGAGGQHKNKTSSCVKITHIPTGIMVRIDGRDQHQNKKNALIELENRVAQQRLDEKAAQKKERRDEKIHDHTTIRTYDYKSMTVKDHRTGKRASLKEVLEKGRIDLLYPDPVDKTPE